MTHQHIQHDLSTIRAYISIQLWTRVIERTRAIESLLIARFFSHQATGRETHHVQHGLLNHRSCTSQLVLSRAFDTSKRAPNTRFASNRPYKSDYVPLYGLQGLSTTKLLYIACRIPAAYV
jgi:hypothetical protein